MTNTRITFEMETCGRCGGTGEYPSPAWQGMCLGCNRTGKRMTRRGQAARKKFDELLNAEMTKAYSEVEAGDRVYYDGKYVTVESLKETTAPDGTAQRIIETPRVIMYGFLADRVRVWDREIWLSIVARVGKMKGATVTTDEPATVEAPAKAAVRPATAPKPSGRTSHADCDHEATPRARAKCRQMRAVLAVQPTETPITDSLNRARQEDADRKIPGLDITVAQAQKIADYVKGGGPIRKA